MKSIYDFVKKQRDDYRSDTIEIVEGYDFSQYETLKTIELYHNSRFISGNKDSLGREKPFYNICKFRVNVAVRATDLDTKDVKIESERVTEKSYAASFMSALSSLVASLMQARHAEAAKLRKLRALDGSGRKRGKLRCDPVHRSLLGKKELARDYVVESVL